MMILNKLDELTKPHQVSSSFEGYAEIKSQFFDLMKIVTGIY